MRFADFRTITRSATVGRRRSTPPTTCWRIAERLLDEVDPTPGVRLLGLSTSNFGAAAEQLTLDGLATAEADAAVERGAEWRTAERTVDEIRTRFGHDVIGPASAVRGQKLHLVRRGAQQWGPDRPNAEPPGAPPDDVRG